MDPFANPDWKAKQLKLQSLMTSDALTAWLRTQPDDGEYQWTDPVNCLMGKYLADHGVAWGDTGYSDMPGYHQIAAQRPWTFGAALGRAEQLALPAPARQIAAPQIKLPEIELEVEHEPAPGNLQLPAPERHPAGGHGALAHGGENLR